MPLTDDEKAILDFERTWWTQDGVKDALVEQQLGMASARYYQVLNDLLSNPEALAYDPLVVRRLVRLRERRRRERLGAGGSS